MDDKWGKRSNVFKMDVHLQLYTHVIRIKSDSLGLYLLQIYKLQWHLSVFNPQAVQLVHSQQWL